MQEWLSRDFFSILGAKTNNLKNLNVHIKINTITAITGISGGGKSSLAYETLYEICKQQFNQLESGSYEYSDYSVDSFHGALPAIALTQNNYNSNPRSTIYSYLDVPSYLYSVIPTEKTSLEHSSLRLNKPGNECPSCQGDRSSWALSERLIFDELIPLDENPFKCWSGANLSKNAALLRAFCEHESIDVKKSLSELSSSQKDKLLYGQSNNKFKISYAFGGKRRSREERYFGPVKVLESYSSSDKASLLDGFRRFSEVSLCSHCYGTGLNPKIYVKGTVSGVSFFDFLRAPISEVVNEIKGTSRKLPPAILALIDQLETLIELGLGYLSLIRQIPGLSGGELQKLRFAQICNTSIRGVMFVLDEVSSQVSTNSHKLLVDKMRQICLNGNTVVMIEHNPYFINAADQVICVGPLPGAEGGYIIPYKENDIPLAPKDRKPKELKMISLPKVRKNNVQNVVTTIPLGAVTGICGVSGSGKSSYALAISEAVPKVQYVSQKQMRGNIRSTVATVLDMVANIASIFSKTSGESSELFLPQRGKLGCCHSCGGTGVIDFTRTFEGTIKITCPVCEGEMFSNKVDAIKAQGMNVKDFYAAALHSLPKELVTQSRKLSRIIEISEAIGVSHLSFNRKTGSLSGGEARRIKMLQSLVSPSAEKILIIDEPGAGLDRASAVKAINYISSCATGFKAILVIDHKQEILERCDYILEFGPGSGPEGGEVVYAGYPQSRW